MKKTIALIFMILLCGILCACGGDRDVKRALKHEQVQIKESPDKYTWYIRDYVGRNVASFGEGEDERYDVYGNGKVYFTYVAKDGSFVSKENYGNYIVIAQSVEPNTELKFQYKKMSSGKEYEKRIETQNIERIELRVARLDVEGASAVYIEENTMSDKAKQAMSHMPASIKPSPDKYTWYMKDYVGRTLDVCGTARLGGFLMDDYGEGGIEFVIIADDGTKIDINDKEQLSKYVVTSQGIAPNSEIKYTFF